jgi:hypothetical protein
MVVCLLDNVRLQAVVSKLRAHAEDYLRYANPPPYNQQLIDTLRLEPAAYLPGVPLANVCRHFRKHFADGVDPEGETESDDDAASYDSDKYGPKWNWFLVIDDEAGEH